MGHDSSERPRICRTTGTIHDRICLIAPWESRLMNHRVGGGLWHPEAAPTAAMRTVIDSNAERLKDILRDSKMRAEFLGGASDTKKAVKAFVQENAGNALKTKPKVSLHRSQTPGCQFLPVGVVDAPSSKRGRSEEVIAGSFEETRRARRVLLLMTQVSPVVPPVHTS